jgi:ABC-type antimicrobial peptide transport system permease subunit
VGFSQAVTLLQGWPTAVSPDSIVVAFGFAAFIGVFFGFYPAIVALQLLFVT